MNSAMISAMDPQIQEAPVASDVRNLMRMCALTYSDFLRHSPSRSPEMNQQCLAEAIIYRGKAIALGANDETIDESLRKLRAFWVPRLGRERSS